MRNKKNDLTLAEIKKNINYFDKRYSIQGLALVGGDPFLYPDIIPLLNFLNDKYLSCSKIRHFTLCSEALKCSSMSFVSYLTKFFGSQTSFYGSLHISLNNFSPNDKFLEKRKKAILNLAKRGFRLHFVLVFTKNNLSAIIKAVSFLTNIFSRYYSDFSPTDFMVELRLPFNSDDNKSGLFILESKQFLKSFRQISNLLFKKQIPLALRNIPLCYLEKKRLVTLDRVNFIKTNIDKIAVRINKENQFDKAEVNTFGKKGWSLQKDCFSCILKDKCNGISFNYINYFDYPVLKPLVK